MQEPWRVGRNKRKGKRVSGEGRWTRGQQTLAYVKSTRVPGGVDEPARRALRGAACSIAVRRAEREEMPEGARRLHRPR